MSSTRYIISDASKRVEVEPHVLRYWEEELELAIPRNEMGHRYYKQEDIDTLKAVKVLKDQGFQLKAIKMIIPNLNKINGLDAQSILKLREELNEKAIELEIKEGFVETEDGTRVTMNHKILSDTATRKEENKIVPTSKEERAISGSMEDKMGQFKVIMHGLIVNALQENNATLSENLSTEVSESVIKEMDYLLRLKEEREEERYKKFDETIRDYQKSRFEIAASKDNKSRKKRKIFRKNKQ